MSIGYSRGKSREENGRTEGIIRQPGHFIRIRWRSIRVQHLAQLIHHLGSRLLRGGHTVGGEFGDGLV